MNNYTELAHRTSAPTEPVTNRLVVNETILLWLLSLCRWTVPLLQTLDTWKRLAFYGKGETPGNLTMETHEVAMQNGLRAIMLAKNIELIHAIVGIASEAGELLDALQRVIFVGEEWDETNLHEEGGDTLWYLAKLFKFTGTDFREEMARNIGKLKVRFPDKFSEGNAIERDLNAERRALEAAAEPPRKPFEEMTRDEMILDYTKLRASIAEYVAGLHKSEKRQVELEHTLAALRPTAEELAAMDRLGRTLEVALRLSDSGANHPAMLDWALISMMFKRQAAIPS
jgi:NTP pyrophosphatase (non-canonical NTP hydrolase)